LTILQTILLAIVEGLTEFLPISSTGHMMIVQKIMNVPSSDFTKAFIVCIQLGAILSVVVLYWKRFFQSFEFYYKLLVAFIPAAVFGFLFSDKIDALLENVLNVGIALLIGGIIFLFIEKLIRERSLREPSYKSAFVIGLFQCIAMIPGVSRSAATVIGGLTQGLSKKPQQNFHFS
jgi:undecaprenyl-diphosphatase